MDQEQLSAEITGLTAGLVFACHGQAYRMGWWTNLTTGVDERFVYQQWLAHKVASPRNIGDLISLVHSEVSEAYEGHRKRKMDDHLPHRPALEVELADAVIRICDMAGGLGLDLPGALAEKLAYNASRVDHGLTHRREATDGKQT